ncbi:hypothetical protein Fmac_029180 [Flemingia macrophylla]|uniref:Uncharacterized protein n=1 Tax=Flemingia macrophylla TaxID=520843 RepID=A0ABD1L9R8_9FABA
MDMTVRRSEYSSSSLYRSTLPPPRVSRFPSSAYDFSLCNHTRPILYHLFKYLDTYLKKFIDSHRKDPNPRPLPPPSSRASSSSSAKASPIVTTTSSSTATSSRRISSLTTTRGLQLRC